MYILDVVNTVLGYHCAWLQYALASDHCFW
jgi:hypothetical protein